MMGNVTSRNFISDVTDFKRMAISESQAHKIIYHVYRYVLKESPETKNMLDHYDGLSLENLSDSYIFRELCWVIYCSGFRFDIVKKYWPSLSKGYCFFDVHKVASFLSDIENHAYEICRISGFNNLKKAKWCIQNAQRIIELNHEKGDFGGLKGFFRHISLKEPFELVEFAPILVKDLKFKGIGNTTIFHLLKNFGINIFKPDIHVRRFLANIGLIKNDNSLFKDICSAMQYLSDCTGLNIIELDTLLFNYGRIAKDCVDLYKMNAIIS